MALFSMRVQVIKRSAGKSVVAAAAYRASERLHDARQGITHDYSRKGGVIHTELLIPSDAPAWTHGLDREALWNMVDARERRRDSQTARELRIMIPRELNPQERISVVREFVQRSFVSKGMVADVCWHDKVASDGQSQPHAHVMLTMRPLTPEGFGDKARHDMVPEPSGRTQPDGRPVLVESNPDSWNSAAYYERCREDWESTANAALERAGSAERIDRRSYLERGLARLPEPALRLAYHLKELRGVMQERWGQFQYARFYRAVEERAKDAFARLDQAPIAAEATRTFQRFHDWFDRQVERLAPAREPPPREPPPLSPELER
ncbi:MobQ family relaxase [Brevundimonas sp. VNH65]|uniref:MobQ family relaxase n=1 Tax=Brevundimonas sp. VNH65 TaxID=3400917 RepID=UPI003C0B1C92